MKEYRERVKERESLSDTEIGGGGGGGEGRGQNHSCSVLFQSACQTLSVPITGNGTGRRLAKLGKQGRNPF